MLDSIGASRVDCGATVALSESPPKLTSGTPSGGSWSATLQPGYVYSFTTTTTAGHGTQGSPPQASLALPYSDSFDADTLGAEPKYLAQQQGAFETVACGGGRAGRVSP